MNIKRINASVDSLVSARDMLEKMTISPAQQVVYHALMESIGKATTDIKLELDKHVPTVDLTQAPGGALIESKDEELSGDAKKVDIHNWYKYHTAQGTYAKSITNMQDVTHDTSYVTFPHTWIELLKTYHPTAEWIAYYLYEIYHKERGSVVTPPKHERFNEWLENGGILQLFIWGDQYLNKTCYVSSSGPVNRFGGCYREKAMWTEMCTLPQYYLVCKRVLLAFDIALKYAPRTFERLSDDFPFNECSNTDYVKESDIKLSRELGIIERNQRMQKDAIKVMVGQIERVMNKGKYTRIGVVRAEFGVATY